MISGRVITAPRDGRCRRLPRQTMSGGRRS
jgi:hypothetical protein